MPVAIKICGISNFEIYKHCAHLSVDWVGFVFFAPSPRHITLSDAASLIQKVDRDIDPQKSPKRVALVVDATDDEISDICKAIHPDMLQLHGNETAQRISDIKTKFQRPVMRAIKIAKKQDVDQAHLYEDVADWLLFDAAISEKTDQAISKKPSNIQLPGGMGIPFHWSYMKDAHITLPWMLAGGLNPQNVTTAVQDSHAFCVDVSSGVEEKQGSKSASAISSFVETARQISSPLL